MTTRRAFLVGLAAASLPRVAWAEVGSPAFLAAGKLGQGYVLHGLGAGGDSLFQIALPARGHAAAAHPSQALAVAFARRPGSYALVIDCLTGAVQHRLTPPLGRQFNGHGVFSADGGLLMTSEVVAEGSAGRIGLWDSATFARIGEWDCHGIGPHDIKRLPDGRVVVANGGIQTDPADRTKLNIATMRPNLALLSAQGALLDRVEVAGMPQNSVRHLTVVGGGVAFAMQWQGDPSEAVPLVGRWVPGRPVTLYPPRTAEAGVMRGYAGSIASAADGSLAVTSAPGGVMLLFGADGSPLQTLHRADISGVAASGAGFVATDGQGVVWSCANGAFTPLARHETLWDNHLVPVGT